MLADHSKECYQRTASWNKKTAGIDTAETAEKIITATTTAEMTTAASK